MGRYLLNRLLQSLVTLFLVSVVIFAGVRAMPGDPALLLAGDDPSPETVAAINEQYGFDRAWPLQYLTWIGQMLRWDFGESIRTGMPVSETILTRLPATLELAALSLLVAALVGVLAGVAAAVRQGRPTDWLANGVALLGLSVPNFWLGLMGILVFAVALGWLPASGYVPFFESPAGNLASMVMPAIVLGTGLAAIILRQTRSSMIEALSSDYVRTARAKGMTPRRVVAHALRNSLITVLTILGLQLGALISGTVVTEQIFVLPGFGRLMVESVFTRDFPVIQATVMVTAVGYILVNLVVDLLYSVVDPRIRVQGGAR
ncbi:ABC transporter permease [Actinoalloteichus sp. AHMU CJ021]|uniref:Peptide/nickel transport system permease protein n=2 Tax=Actinoalloteichus cyanogriseus TaxID=2893586 RepID=A0ABT1JEF0_ACTCY|nr:ABC transporter permease [Actinoalloteichus caeruleus]AUS81125.1 ABC transporter permease [Actinoalloteichus sp. AHMU CJ021]MCP2330664.1 peptide/nickel transport system permease protein [Actinoalloteichus caeruleus DSM 43889]